MCLLLFCRLYISNGYRDTPSSKALYSLAQVNYPLYLSRSQKLLTKCTIRAAAERFTLSLNINDVQKSYVCSKIRNGDMEPVLRTVGPFFQPLDEEFYGKYSVLSD